MTFRFPGDNEGSTIVSEPDEAGGYLVPLPGLSVPDESRNAIISGRSPLGPVAAIAATRQSKTGPLPIGLSSPFSDEPEAELFLAASAALFAAASSSLCLRIRRRNSQ